MFRNFQIETNIPDGPRPFADSITAVAPVKAVKVSRPKPGSAAGKTETDTKTVYNFTVWVGNQAYNTRDYETVGNAQDAHDRIVGYRLQERP